MQMIISFLISPVLALLSGLFLMGISRKIAARIQWHNGPPIVQPFIDTIRSFSQKSVSHGILFDIGIGFSLASSLALVLFIPIGKLDTISSGGLIALLYLMLLPPFGIALSATASGNPNSSIGVSRQFLLALAYEVPLLMILLAVMTHYHTISLVEIVKIQASTGWTFFSWALLLPGIAYFLILPAILGIRPFEVVSAPQEISSGQIAEFGGKFLAFYTLQQAVNLFVGLALFVDIFLGGETFFGLLNPIAGTVWEILAGILIFLLKMVVVLIAGLMVNAVFPRLRIEQAMVYLWKWPTLIAFIGLVVVILIH